MAISITLDIFTKDDEIHAECEQRNRDSELPLFLWTASRLNPAQAVCDATRERCGKVCDQVSVGLWVGIVLHAGGTGAGFLSVGVRRNRVARLMQHGIR
jgi:hypothetical protein